MTARSEKDVTREMLESVRKAMMEANIALADEAHQAREERDAALAEVARVTALFESCIPPTAEEWNKDTPRYGEGWMAWDAGWDSCRQKLIDLLRRPR